VEKKTGKNCWEMVVKKGVCLKRKRVSKTRQKEDGQVKRKGRGTKMGRRPSGRVMKNPAKGLSLLIFTHNVIPLVKIYFRAGEGV